MRMEGGKGACVYARTSRDNATRQSKICLPWGWRGGRGRVYMRALHVIMLPDNLKFACHGDGWGVRGRVISDLLPTGLHQCSTTGLQQPDTHNNYLAEHWLHKPCVLGWIPATAGLFTFFYCCLITITSIK